TDDVPGYARPPGRGRPGLHGPGYGNRESALARVTVRKGNGGYSCSMTSRLGEYAAKSVLAAGLAAGGIMLGCSSHAGQNPQGGGIPAMPVKVVEAKAMPVSDA